MATQTFNFDQTDEDPFVDANWETFLTNPGKIVSNAWAPNGANSGVRWKESVTNFGDDQYSQAAIQTDGLGQSVVMVRMDTSGNGYGVLVSSTVLSIRSYASGSPTVLASQSGLTIIAGDVIKIVVEGTSIRAYQNDVERVSTTDSTYTTGQPGIFSQRAEAGTNPELDNWEGSDEITVTFTLTGDNVFSDFSQSASATGALSLVGQNVFDDLSQSASAVGALNLSGANTFNDLSQSALLAGAVDLIGQNTFQNFSQSASAVGAVDLTGQNIFNDFSDTATIDVGRVLIGQNTFDDFSAAGVLDNTSFNHFIATCVFSDFSTDGNLVRPVVSVAEKRKVSIPATSRQITIEG